MEHQLFCIEGLPASGKSTTAGFVEEILRGQGKKVIAVDEGQTAIRRIMNFTAF